MIEHVIKRNGDKVIFSEQKIYTAISNACDAINEPDKSFINDLVSSIVKELQDSTIKDNSFSAEDVSVSVETIQDLTEIELMKSWKYMVAREYIVYRDKKKAERIEKQAKILKKFENNTLKVTKKDWSKENFDLKKIQDTFNHATMWYEKDCAFEDFMEAFKKNIIDEIKTGDITKLMIKTCIDLITIENIYWENIAWRLLTFDLYKQANRNRWMDLNTLYTPDTFLALYKDYVSTWMYYSDFVKYYSEDDILKMGSYIKKVWKQRDLKYNYTTVQAFNKRYLNNKNKVIKELPQEMYMMVALFLAIPENPDNRLNFAKRVYDYCSTQKISLPTPTLQNARTQWTQLSSCFISSMDDDLRWIYHTIENMAQVSKFGGGLWCYLWHLRAKGASIRGYEWVSGGVIPWVKQINDEMIAVNQLWSRKGSCSPTLDIWHLDIYDFLELQTETGDIRWKSFDIFPAVSIPHLFMERMTNWQGWTLFDPYEIEKVYWKKIQNTYGEEFNKFYLEIEWNNSLKMKKVIDPKDLFKQLLKTTVETWMPYVFFRDTVNELNPQKHAGMIHSSNLCNEINQNTSPSTFIEETSNNDITTISHKMWDMVVCNLANINLAAVSEKEISDIMRVITRIVDNVITLNYYPVKEAEYTAKRYRSVGIWYMWLAEYLARHQLNFEDETARLEVDRLLQKYTIGLYTWSAELAQERGTYSLYKWSEFDKWIILWKNKEQWISENKDWEGVFSLVEEFWLRFAYHTAIPPTTSTAGVVWTTAWVMPIYKKYFVETNLSWGGVKIAPKLDHTNFWYYKEYHTMDMNEVIKMIATIQKYIDQSISFEWMIDPARISPKDLYTYYVSSWKLWIKTVYYVRSLSSEIKDSCVSCAG